MSAPETATTPVTFKRRASWEGIRLDTIVCPSASCRNTRIAKHVVMISLTEGAAARYELPAVRD